VAGRQAEPPAAADANQSPSVAEPLRQQSQIAADMHGLAESSRSYLVRADLSVLHAQSLGCPPPGCGRGGAAPVR
jgi:hypothetical protein